MGLKICMIGLGSIGKRHVKNIMRVLDRRNIGYEIDALRSSRAALSDEIDGVIQERYYSVDALPDDYDIMFITNPTSCHYETIRSVLGKTKHMFIEKPVFDSLAYDLSELPLQSGGVYYVACPLRHKSIMQYVKKELLPREKVISARVMSSSYLPAWRKGTDYRETYSARRDMGGGVTRDMIHEWDYVWDLFGCPAKIYHIQRHISGLEIDSDDISVYMAEYPEMLLEMHLDYIGQKTERYIQLFMDRKRIDVDLIKNVVIEYAGNEQISERCFPEEDCYINEMEYFMTCVEGKEENINTVKNAYRTLRTVLAEE